MPKNLTLIFILLSSYSFAQSGIVTLEIDEFTGDTTYTTEWEKINSYVRQAGPATYFKFIKADGVQSFLVKNITHEAVHVDEGAEFFFKTEDGTIIKEQILSDEISQVGGGSIGLYGSDAIGIGFPISISEGTIEKLSKSPIEAMRFTTSSSGYVEMHPDGKKLKKRSLQYFSEIKEWLDSRR